jgi:hypothetical protein
MVWTRAISIVADAADGADDVMESVLTRGRDPDRAHSQSALAAEHNFNPECAEERLRPAQPASEYAWTLWPARPAGAQLQKIGCASPPLRFVGHNLAYERRHRIGVDNALDRGAPVVRKAASRVPAGRNALSQAVAQSAKSAMAVARVKEPGGRCDIEEDVRAAHGARPLSARPMAI